MRNYDQLPAVELVHLICVRSQGLHRWILLLPNCAGLSESYVFVSFLGVIYSEWVMTPKGLSSKSFELSLWFIEIWQIGFLWCRLWCLTKRDRASFQACRNTSSLEQHQRRSAILQLASAKCSFCLSTSKEFYYNFLHIYLSLFFQHNLKLQYVIFFKKFLVLHICSKCHNVLTV